MGVAAGALEVVPWAAAAFILLALAVWLLWLDVRRPVNQAFALFLSLRGLLSLAQGIYTNPPAPTWELAGAVHELAATATPALYIAVPFAAVHFALVYHGTYARSESSFRGALIPLLLATVPITAYALEPTLWIGPDGAGPLFLFAGLTYLVYASIALMMGREALQQPPDPPGAASTWSAWASPCCRSTWPSSRWRCWT